MPKRPKTIKHRTAWHPLFVHTLRLILPRGSFSVHGEYQLNHQPLRIDAVVIRKQRGLSVPLPPCLAPLTRYLGGITIIEFKGPSATLDQSSYLRLLGYAFFFCDANHIGDPAQVQLMTVSRHLGPFRDCAERFRGTFTKVEPGVYRVTGLPYLLHCIETEAAGDHVLQLFSSSILTRPDQLYSLLNEEERAIFVQVFNEVERFRRNPHARLRYHDYEEFLMSLDEALDILLTRLPPERKHKFLKGLPPEERLKDLPPEERLKGLSPEELERIKKLLQ